MGVCKTCNQDAGWLSHECSECRERREADAAAKAAADREAAERERQARIDEMVGSAMARVKATTDAGGTTNLYDTVVVDLADGLIDARGLDRLRDLGERGWQIATMCPKVDVQRSFGGEVSDIRIEQAQILVGLTIASWNAQLLDGEIRKHFASRAAEEIDSAEPAPTAA